MARFIISTKKAIEQYNTLKSITPFISYSSKTNQSITKILEEKTDAFFSVHLENELKHIKDKSRVIFLAQGWNEEKIASLLHQKITHFVVDNPVDLNILTKYLEQHKPKIHLFLRMKLKENTLRTERHFVFGMDSSYIQKKITELKDKVETIGIHFHRKTQNLSEWSLTEELKDILTPDTLNTIDYLNIGGGLPSEYNNTNVKVIDGIIKKIEHLRDWLSEYNITMIIEPGRFIAAPAVELKTTILRIYENNIIVDASVYNSDLDALIVPIKLKLQEETKKGTPYAIKGVTPCSTDLFRYRAYLTNPKEGEELTFLNAGAYNFHSDFCDLGIIKEEIK